jgi:hypothetical protein
VRWGGAGPLRSLLGGKTFGNSLAAAHVLDIKDVRR